MSNALTASVYRRDRAVVIVGLVSIVTLSWAYLFYMAWDMMNSMGMEMSMDMVMPDVRPWGWIDFAFIFGMWAIMQVAMMTPSASPMILTYARFGRQQNQGHAPFVMTTIFFLGYIVVWIVFSALAATMQWGLHSAALLSPMMVGTSPIVGGLILIAAGFFQFTALKHACLHHCRSPLSFIMTEWRSGRSGAFAMGVRHGSYCVGCCWLLMTILFVAGVMNLLWISLIAVYVLIEKVFAGGHRIGQAAGILALILGIWMIATA